MSSESEIKVLSTRVDNLSEKVDELKGSVQRMDEKIDRINEMRLPSLQEELATLRTKSAMFGGFFGALGSALVSLVLWIIESGHR